MVILLFFFKIILTYPITLHVNDDTLQRIETTETLTEVPVDILHAQFSTFCKEDNQYTQEESESYYFVNLENDSESHFKVEICHKNDD